MIFWKTETYIDKVKMLVKGAIKKAEKGIKASEDYRNKSYTPTDINGVKGPISDTDGNHASVMFDAVNVELVAELRQIANMIESKEIYK